MAREQFNNSLRVASKLLRPTRVSSDREPEFNSRTGNSLDNADLWLTPRVVADYHPGDYGDKPAKEVTELELEISRFLEVAHQVPANQPATGGQSEQARRHLQAIIDIVREWLLVEWLAAQEHMMDEATQAAQSRNWHVDRDDKGIQESLLGTYRSPRLRIRTPDSEVVLDPIALFGSGGKGIVDLVVLPRYETACMITLRNGQWQIVSPYGSLNQRPFNKSNFIDLVSGLSKA